MSSDYSVAFTQLNRLRESLGKVRASHRKAGRFFWDMFDALQQMANHIGRQQQEWQAQRDKAENELSRQSMELDARQAELDLKLLEVERAEETLSKSAAPAESFLDDSRLQTLLDAGEEERETMHRVIEAAKTQSGQISKVLEHVNETCGEIQRYQDSLKLARNQQVPDREIDQQLKIMQDKLKAAEKQIAQLVDGRMSLERERNMLEAELETVRYRADDIARAAKLKEREAESQKAEWAVEFGQQKALLEDIRCKLDESRGTQGRSAPPDCETKRRPEEKADGDVIDSVLAQFQVIQRDVARRRGEASG